MSKVRVLDGWPLGNAAHCQCREFERATLRCTTTKSQKHSNDRLLTQLDTRLEGVRTWHVCAMRSHMYILVGCLCPSLGSFGILRRTAIRRVNDLPVLLDDALRRISTGRLI